VRLARRIFLAMSILGFATEWVPVAASLAAGSQEKTPRKIRWRVPIAHLDTVKENLRFDGTVEKETNEKGLTLVFIFVGTVLLTYLADAVLALRREILYGGIVIDTRGSETKITNDKRLDAGVMVVISPSGTELYERDEIENPTELVAALLKAK
jgi:hypothetical protein